MANRQAYTFSESGSQIFNLDWRIAPFQVTAAAIVPAGATATFTIEGTLDLLNLPSGASNPDIDWFPLDIPTNSNTVILRLPYPMTALRVTATVTAGEVRVKVLQPYSIN